MISFYLLLNDAICILHSLGMVEDDWGMLYLIINHAAYMVAMAIKELKSEG